MVDITIWLEGQGLGQYAARFAEHALDLDVLGELTDADLRELGLPLGHRKRLLRAIADLQVPAADLVPAPVAAREAERRQLTVMFVDLVGSTELAAQLDPEELREVIRTYQNAVAGEIARFDGHLAKFMGDGVLTYFGWPKAHEDEAERAVRAALAVVAAIGRLTTPSGERLAARIGIATGLVVVGDLVGEGAAQEEAVVGETPNLAARLQALAEPGGIVISRRTRRLVGGLFELADLGPQRLKGFTEPVRAWRVVGFGAVESRFEAMHTTALTPLVGREHELGLLLDRWKLAKGGEGRVVLLSGEPGIGKSRIARALLERVADEPHTRLRYYCSPYHVNSALFPVIDQLERAADLRLEDTAKVRLDKLETVLAEATEDVREAIPLLATLLSIPTDGHYPAPNLTPQAQKARTFDVLLGQLEGVAARQPVLMVLEDAQWIDPTSAELFGLVLDRIQRLPVLLLVTFRPELVPPWTGYAHVTALTLSRLGQRQGAQMVERLTGSKRLPPEVLEQIVARTDGVPLFIEELTKTVLESGLLHDAGDRFELTGLLPPLAIPATLHDSLLARLDRLAPIKEVAQIGSVIGREFSHELLAAVTDRPEDQLRPALDQLVSSELVFRRGTPPDATYAFKHALVQDTAYQSLLKSRRQQLHGRIARAVEERFPEIGESRPEWLAHHYTEAGLVGPATEGWLKTAQRAKDAYANKEATAHLHRCLETIKAWRATTGEQVPESEQWELRALVMLGDLTSLAGDLEEANRRYGQALAIARDAETRRQIANRQHRPRTAFRDGARIVFYEHGAGSHTLLFVAPLVYGLAAFQPIVERLCQEFRIVTVDSRGTGASDPLTRPYPLSEHMKDLCAVIDALGGGPVIGVGISRGGNLLLKLAHARPRLFTKLVTIGCPPGLPGQPPWFSEAYLQQHSELVAKRGIDEIVRFHTALVLSEPETRELRELFIQNRLQLPHETMASFFDPDPSVDVTSILPEITVPTLVIQGREDRLIAFAASEYLAARLPDAMVYGFEGKGHMPLFTATDEFCAVLRRFVLGELFDTPA